MGSNGGEVMVGSDGGELIVGGRILSFTCLISHTEKSGR